MDGKTKVELDNETARQFELFLLLKVLVGERKLEYRQSQFLEDGRIIIHFKTDI